MNREKEIHDKAIRLIEGGIVEVDGLCVTMKYGAEDKLACLDCEMDSICQNGSSMNDLCVACDLITEKTCFLELTNKK